MQSYEIWAVVYTVICFLCVELTVAHTLSKEENYVFCSLLLMTLLSVSLIELNPEVCVRWAMKICFLPFLSDHSCLSFVWASHAECDSSSYTKTHILPLCVALNIRVNHLFHVVLCQKTVMCQYWGGGTLFEISCICLH